MVDWAERVIYLSPITSNTLRVTSHVCGQPTIARSVADFSFCTALRYRSTERSGDYLFLLVESVASLSNGILLVAESRVARSQRAGSTLVFESKRFGELSPVLVSEAPGGLSNESCRGSGCLMRESTAGRLVTLCTHRRRQHPPAALCPALRNLLSCLIAPPLTRGGSDRITFQSLTKCREFTYVLILFSIPNSMNDFRIENDHISETSCMSELSSIQLVSVCHCNEFILNVFDCF